MPEITYEEYYHYYVTLNMRYEEIATELSKKYGIPISVATIQHLNYRKFHIKKSPAEYTKLRKETMLKKYGYEYGYFSENSKKHNQEETNQKIKKSLQNKTKEDWDKIIAKRKATNLEKYGTEFPQQTSDVKDKMKVTNTKKYGGPAPIYDKNIKEKIFKNKTINLNNNVGRDTDYDMMPNFEINQSRYEDELIKLLRGHNIFNIEENSKKYLNNQEIDIYLPDYKLGIEFNGNYWHCDLQNKMQDHSGRSVYHQNKSLLAEQNGIFLFHIFEYEWTDTVMKEKIINHLLNILNKNKNKIYARKCTIQEVSKNAKKDFLEKNHLQGNDNSSICLGLYYNDTLVSVMTFCKARFTKTCTWELSRFCSLAGYNILGGANKLFTYFLQNYTKPNENIVSYSDITKTKGNLYNILGFKFSHISQPNYVWWNSRTKEILSRYQTRMKNEVQKMHAADYHRICDCGTKVWIYKNREN